MLAKLQCVPYAFRSVVRCMEKVNIHIDRYALYFRQRMNNRRLLYQLVRKQLSCSAVRCVHRNRRSFRYLSECFRVVYMLVRHKHSLHRLKRYTAECQTFPQRLETASCVNKYAGGAVTDKNAVALA